MKNNKEKVNLQIDTPRKKLLSLEKEGNFVFHGSPNTISVLEPRQAYNYSDETGVDEKDGRPALFATLYADIAIFRSLIYGVDESGESVSEFSLDQDGLHFALTKKILAAAKEKIGKVYVLDKKHFKGFEGMQCKSEKLVIPLEVIDVTVDDLSPDIKIIS